MTELARMLLAELGPLLTLVLPLALLVCGIRLARSQAPVRAMVAGRPPARRVAAAEAVAASEIELPPPHEVELQQEVELPPSQELELPPLPAGEAAVTEWSLLDALHAVAQLDLPNPARRRSGGATGIDELVDRIGARLLNRTLAEHGFRPGTRIWEQTLPAARLAALYAANPDRADWN